MGFEHLSCRSSNNKGRFYGLGRVTVLPYHSPAGNASCHVIEMVLKTSVITIIIMIMITITTLVRTGYGILTDVSHEAY